MKIVDFRIITKKYHKFIWENKLQHLSGFILGVSIIIIFLIITRIPLPGNMESNDLPNWITLIAEIIVGITISAFIYKIQSNTDKLRNDILEEIRKMTIKIDTYIENKRHLDANTKKFYYDKVKDNLKAIKTADEKTKEIIKNTIEKGNLLNSNVMYYIIEKSSEIKYARILTIHDALEQLKGNLKNPNTRLEILTYLDALDGPYKELSDEYIWTDKTKLNLIVRMIDIHLEEIMKYLTMLEDEYKNNSKSVNI
jgi:hypothetical protein